ncbi:Uncharacterised protein g4237 [Pycnogonum litorale]
MKEPRRLLLTILVLYARAQAQTVNSNAYINDVYCAGNFDSHGNESIQLETSVSSQGSPKTYRELGCNLKVSLIVYDSGDDKTSPPTVLQIQWSHGGPKSMYSFKSQDLPTNGNATIVDLSDVSVDVPDLCGRLLVDFVLLNDQATLDKVTKKLEVTPAYEARSLTISQVTAAKKLQIQRNVSLEKIEVIVNVNGPSLCKTVGNRSLTLIVGLKIGQTMGGEGAFKKIGEKARLSFRDVALHKFNLIDDKKINTGTNVIPLDGLLKLDDCVSCSNGTLVIMIDPSMAYNKEIVPEVGWGMNVMIGCSDIQSDCEKSCQIYPASDKPWQVWITKPGKLTNYETMKLYTATKNKRISKKNVDSVDMKAAQVMGNEPSPSRKCHYEKALLPRSLNVLTKVSNIINSTREKDANLVEQFNFVAPFFQAITTMYKTLLEDYSEYIAQIVTNYMRMIPKWRYAYTNMIGNSAGRNTNTYGTCSDQEFIDAVTSLNGSLPKMFKMENMMKTLIEMNGGQVTDIAQMMMKMKSYMTSVSSVDDIKKSMSMFVQVYGVTINESNVMDSLTVAFKKIGGNLPSDVTMERVVQTIFERKSNYGTNSNDKFIQTVRSFGGSLPDTFTMENLLKTLIEMNGGQVTDITQMMMKMKSYMTGVSSVDDIKKSMSMFVQVYGVTINESNVMDSLTVAFKKIGGNLPSDVTMEGIVQTIFDRKSNYGTNSNDKFIQTVRSFGGSLPDTFTMENLLKTLIEMNGGQVTDITQMMMKMKSYMTGVSSVDDIKKSMSMFVQVYGVTINESNVMDSLTVAFKKIGGNLPSDVTMEGIVQTIFDRKSNYGTNSNDKFIQTVRYFGGSLPDNFTTENLMRHFVEMNGGKVTNITMRMNIKSNMTSVSTIDDIKKSMSMLVEAYGGKVDDNKVMDSLTAAFKKIGGNLPSDVTMEKVVQTIFERKSKYGSDSDHEFIKTVRSLGGFLPTDFTMENFMRSLIEMNGGQVTDITQMMKIKSYMADVSTMDEIKKAMSKFVESFEGQMDEDNVMNSLTNAFEKVGGHLPDNINMEGIIQTVLNAELDKYMPKYKESASGVNDIWNYVNKYTSLYNNSDQHKYYLSTYFKHILFRYPELSEVMKKAMSNTELIMNINAILKHVLSGNVPFKFPDIPEDAVKNMIKFQAIWLRSDPSELCGRNTIYEFLKEFHSILDSYNVTVNDVETKTVMFILTVMEEIQSQGVSVEVVKFLSDTCKLIFSNDTRQHGYMCMDIDGDACIKPWTKVEHVIMAGSYSKLIGKACYSPVFLCECGRCNKHGSANDYKDKMVDHRNAQEDYWKNSFKDMYLTPSNPSEHILT